MFGRRGWFPFVGLLAVMGCGREVTPPRTVPVSGQVMLKGKPAAGVRVTFHPQFNIGATKFMPSGETGTDGRFTLSTGAAGNGAPAGKYVVTFEKPLIVSDRKNSGIEMEVDEWKGKHGDPASSAWKVTIAKGDAPWSLFNSIDPRAAMRRRTIHPLLPMIVAAFVLTGCNQRPLPDVFVVQGKLLVGGQPAANASLAFHPVGEQAARLACPVGTTRPDGSYRLTTHAPGDGAPPGEYVVTVIWPDPAQPIDECDCLDPLKHDQLRGLYANPRTSLLHATVRAEANEIVLRATTEP